MATELAFAIAFVYAIVESLEKFGLSRRIAHLLALPLGIITSYAYLPGTSIREHLLKGMLIGLAAVGTCDSTCNVIDLSKRKVGLKK